MSKPKISYFSNLNSCCRDLYSESNILFKESLTETILATKKTIENHFVPFNLKQFPTSNFSHSPKRNIKTAWRQFVT